jgi:hypothetical protein
MTATMLELANAYNLPAYSYYDLQNVDFTQRHLLVKREIYLDTVALKSYRETCGPDDKTDSAGMFCKAPVFYLVDTDLRDTGDGYPRIQSVYGHLHTVASLNADIGGKAINLFPKKDSLVISKLMTKMFAAPPARVTHKVQYSPFSLNIHGKPFLYSVRDIQALEDAGALPSWATHIISNRETPSHFERAYRFGRFAEIDGEDKLVTHPPYLIERLIPDELLQIRADILENIREHCRRSYVSSRNTFIINSDQQVVSLPRHEFLELHKNRVWPKTNIEQATEGVSLWGPTTFYPVDSPLANLKKGGSNEY